MKKIIVPAIVILILAPFALVIALYVKNQQKPTAVVESFEDCIKVEGAVIRESYPEVCVLPNGQTYTKQISVTAPPVVIDPLQPITVDTIFDMLTMEDKSENKKIIKGTLLTGNQIDRGYCAKGIYLKDDSGKIQLRMRTQEGNDVLFTDTTALGIYVEILGIYPTKDNTCFALMCECDDYMVVENVEVLVE